MKLKTPTWLILFVFGMVATGWSQETEQLQFTKWTPKLNVPDPVAISFDFRGNAYVTQTTRRKANDLDIRNNRDWTVNDVSFQSVEDKRQFYRSRLATEFSDRNKRRVKDLNQDGFHDYRDLMQLSEKIHLVRDTDGDGFADSIQVFAADFKTEVTGIAAGVLHFQGADDSDAVYATIAPDVWKLVDDDGDGKADRREKIATGFGLHIAYAGHDMHGLTVGPDGKIYWSIGDKGISVKTKEGRRFHFPNQGGVMRCNPDGSDFEVFAHGLRNVQELAFDQYGNLFGVDNDADQPGERERFVYIVKGMDAGWRCHYQYRGSEYNPWTAEKLWQTYHPGQPAYITPPIEYSINGPCGFAFNPGTALNRRYRNYFFLTGAPHGEQIAFRAVSKGASFQMADVHQIGKGVALIGINFGPDGALYGVDWANGYPLNQKGAIWRIDSPSGHKDPARMATQRLLKMNLHATTPENLVAYLGHADQRVRLRAQFELVRRQSFDVLETTATDRDQKQLARIHAIWGMGQLIRKNDKDVEWSGLLTDDDPEIQAQSLKVIADLGSFDAKMLIPVRETDSPRVRFFLFQTLAKHGDKSWLPWLVSVGEAIKPGEVYLRHGLARALAGCELNQQVDLATESQNKTVRLAAVVALRNMASPSVTRFLDDSNPLVREEAARAIHDDFSIENSLPELAKLAVPGSGNTESFLRRSLNANMRLGNPENLQRLVEFVSGEASVKLQVDVLDWIANWERPNPLDRVTGRYRKLAPRKLSNQLKSSIGNVLSKLLSKKSGPVQTAIVKTLGKLKIRLNETGLLDIVRNPDSSESLAVESLNQLATQRSDKQMLAVDAALNSSKVKLRLAGIKHLSRLDPDRGLVEIRKSLGRLKSEYANQRMVQIAAELNSATAIEYLNGLFARYLKDQTGSEFALELLDAITKNKKANDQSNQLLERFRKSSNEKFEGNVIGEFRVCLVGGDVVAGKKLFETHIDAQCTRCHRVGKTGSTVGPPLDGIGKKRKPSHLLESIIQPSAEIEKEFQTVLIALFSGKTLSGVKIEDDDDSITIADAMGKKIKVKRDDIEQMGVQKKSLMPEMTKSLSRKEIRDLVAYLKSLK